MCFPLKNSLFRNNLNAMFFCVTVILSLVVSDSEYAFGSESPEYPGDCEITQYVVVGGPWTVTHENGSTLITTWVLNNGRAVAHSHEHFPLGTTYAHYYIRTLYYENGRWWHHSGEYHGVVTPGEGQYLEDLIWPESDCGGGNPDRKQGQGPPCDPGMECCEGT